MKKAVYVYGSLVFLFLLVVGVTAAAFADQADILGASFSVGSADLKLLSDVSLGVEDTNLVDEMPGPVIDNVSPNWSEDYLVKVYNNASTDVALTTNANYETANDPDELRQLIYVEPIPWDDVNSNGVVDDGELGAPLARKTIVKWKTEGYDLGTLTAGELKGVVLRFSTDSLPDSRQGTSALFDFEFNSIGL